jgi:hypothetical protein
MGKFVKTKVPVNEKCLMQGWENFKMLLFAVQENQQESYPTIQHAEINTAQILINRIRLES